MIPRQPREIPHDALLRDLVEQYHELAVKSVVARAKDQPVDPADVLGELAIGTEIGNRMPEARCAAMCQALRAGATVEQVADAVETNTSDVGTQLRAWATRLLREGLITEAEVEEVHALLAIR